MTTDFRALCAELVDELDAWIGYGEEGETADAQEVVDRARAALAEPEPPSLKEQALFAIDVAVADGRLSPDVSNVVRRALEQLDD